MLKCGHCGKILKRKKLQDHTTKVHGDGIINFKGLHSKYLRLPPPEITKVSQECLPQEEDKLESFSAARIFTN